MSFAHLSNDRLNETGAYLAAAEAVRQTPHPVDLRAEDRRWLLTVNHKKARVFARRINADRPLRRASDQDVGGVHAVIFVDLSTSSPCFFVVPPQHSTVGLVDQHRDGWELFD